MARSLRIEYPGAFYHITSRGNERKAVFKSLRDREKFLTYLESATERYGAVIHVYCLMDTHYHLFIETPSVKLSKIMQHINGAYTTYFNRKRERSGHLFQGRYKAILVEADKYAMELSRYVHLNPVRAGIVKRPEEYESPLANLPHSLILGSSQFVAEIKERFIRGRQLERDLPILREMMDRPGLETIEQAVDSSIKNDANLSRQVKMFLCHRYSGKKLSEIGERFGVTESAVSQASRRVRDKRHEDKNLEKLILKIVKKLSLSIV